MPIELNATAFGEHPPLDRGVCSVDPGVRAHDPRVADRTRPRWFFDLIRPRASDDRARAVLFGDVIFAELEYAYSDDEAHWPLAAPLTGNFSQVTAGHRSDSWIWIHDGAAKVAVDTLSSMTHPVKPEIPDEHVERVLEVLGQHYKLRCFELPQLEWHEDQ